MDKITFSERASWYNLETNDIKQNAFLLKLMDLYNCMNPIIIPCSSGEKLVDLAKVSKSVLGYDINSEMLRIAKLQLQKNSIMHAEVKYGDIRNFYIPNNTDIILILNEALQMFDPDSLTFKTILNNILRIYHGIIVIELYDFKNSLAIDRLRYYSYKESGHIVRDLSFEFEGKQIIRFHKSLRTKTGIEIHYYYRIKKMSTNNVTWKTSFVKLYDVNIEKLIESLSHYKGISYSLYSDYNFEFDTSSGKKVLVVDCRKRG